MNQETLNRIDQLGGQLTDKASPSLETLRFDKPLLKQDFFSYCDCYGQFKQAHSAQFQQAPEQFTKDYIDYLFNGDHVCYVNMHYHCQPFTPFTQGSDDYEEWQGDLDEPAIRSAIPACSLEFMFIGQSDGFPNFYFIDLKDRHLPNPRVYSTDHEVYFDEIEDEGVWSDFLLHNFWDKQQAYEAVLALVKKERDNDT